MFWVITRLTPLRTEFISFTHDPSAGLALCKADTFQSYLFHLHSHPQAHDAIQGHPQCWKNNLIPVYLSHLNVKSAHSFWSPFDHKGLEVELLYLAITGNFVVVQWLRLRAPNARGPGSIPGQGTRSHMLKIEVVISKHMDMSELLD